MHFWPIMDDPSTVALYNCKKFVKHSLNNITNYLFLPMELKIFQLQNEK